MAEDESGRSLRLGAATVTVINVGDLQARLAQWIDVPEPRYAAAFEQPLRVPMLCLHVALPDMSVMVDAGAYDFAPDYPYLIPGYQPADLLTQLTEAGVRREDVRHVVITHGHLDHFNGVTVERDGRDEPLFPNARHYLGRADWDGSAIQSALLDAGSTIGRTLGVLHREGLLDLVEGERDLGHGVSIIATPGESPGHQIVRVRSEGRTLYALGDLYHHPIEVDHPSWHVRWADAATTLASRRALTQDALNEDALLVATHIPGIGRLRRTDTGVTWAAG